MGCAVFSKAAHQILQKRIQLVHTEHVHLGLPDSDQYNCGKGAETKILRESFRGVPKTARNCFFSARGSCVFVGCRLQLQAARRWECLSACPDINIISSTPTSSVEKHCPHTSAAARQPWSSAGFLLQVPVTPCVPTGFRFGAEPRSSARGGDISC
jgi:hypothetical protein